MTNERTISSKQIKDAAIARLTKEKADFESFKGTEMFSKLLGIYVEKKATKSQKSNSDVAVKVEETKTEPVNKEYIFNANISRYAMCFAEGIYKDVFETLCSFIKQNEYFARSILKSSKSFTNCIAYAIHNIVDKDTKNISFASSSDYKVYQRAVEFYFDNSQIRFNMMIINPDGYTPVDITDEDLKAENPAYSEAIEIAKQELIAKEKAEAERKAKAEKEKAERKAKEQAKKEKEAKKKAKEEAKKAQGSILSTDVEVEKNPSNEVKKVSPAPKKAENPFRLKPEETEESSNIIQLELF